MVLRYLLLLLLFYGYFSSFAQEKISLVLIPDESQFKLKRTSFSFRDSTDCELFIQKLRSKAIRKGHILFSIDSLDRKANTWNTYIHSGPVIRSLVIEIDSLVMPELKKAGIREKVIAQIPFSSREISRTLKQIQSVYVNNGYPFADIYFEKIHFDSDVVKGHLMIQKGPRFTMNNVIVKGDSSIHAPLVMNLIGIRKKETYNEANLQKTENKLSQQSYLKVIKPPELLFTPQGADLYVYLEKIPVSSVNGIIGFQPDPVAENVALTGEINLKLLNSLNRGENIQLLWQSIKDQTQNLVATFSYPYLFGSNFGIEGELDLYKRDSSFLDFNFKTGINYYFTNTSYLQAFFSGSRDNRLSEASNSSIYNNLGNAAVNLYGIGFHSSRLDYLPNPRKGFDTHLEGGIGHRTSEEGQNNTPIRSLSYQGRFSIDFYLPLFKRHVFKLSNNSEFIGSENGVFQNERYRFGGQQSQRGFNEDDLNATTRTTQTIEYRFLLDRNAFAFLFFDHTWYEDNSSGYLNDQPIGFGTGFSFSTDLGMFSLSYALGKQNDNPVRITEGKIHFGYIAYF